MDTVLLLPELSV